MKKRIILWIALLPGVAAQAQTLHRTECPLGYDQYIGRVWRENLSYAAEKLNVRIADAEVKAAGVYSSSGTCIELWLCARSRISTGWPGGSSMRKFGWRYEMLRAENGSRSPLACWTMRPSG